MSNELKQAPSPYLSMAVNFVTNPWVLAGLGGAAGYYFFGRKDGKTIEGKRPYVAAGVGCAAGLAAGKLLQSYRMQQAQLAPQAQAQAQMPSHDHTQPGTPAQDGYYDMDSVETPDVDAAFNQPPMAQQQAQQQAQDLGVPLQADLEEPLGLGSLDGTSLGSQGLGSFVREIGMDAYDELVDEAADEASRRGAN